MFIFLGSLYGSGVLLVRDYARRWNKGWRSILLLGAAYGIIEEGIPVRSFFSPTWKDLGTLATYGHWSTFFAHLGMLNRLERANVSVGYH